MAVKQQSEKDIQSLSGLQGLRKKLSIYAGGSDGSAKFTCVREVTDNSIDEASAGRNKYLHLIRTDRQSFWVIDQGGGMPVGPIKIENPLTHKMESVSALKAQVGLVHSGGKFDLDSEDGGMRGSHGIGQKLSNAASNVFQSYTFRDKQWWMTEYKKGKETVPVKKCSAPKLPADAKVGTPVKGTCTYLELDDSVFDDGCEIDLKEIVSWFDMAAAFTTNLTLKFTDLFEGDAQEWECDGPAAYLKKILARFKATSLQEDTTFIAKGKLWDLALAFTDYDGAGLEGFSNGLANSFGGTHVKAVYDAICPVIAQHAKKGHSFDLSDLRDGIVGVINIKLTGIKFHNQEKSKVTDERAGNPLRDEIIPEIEQWFAKRKDLALLLCERASKLSELKSEFRQNKKVMKILKDAKRKGALPNKLATSMNCTNEEREIFLVEGDSASGSAKRARDSHFQEVLPLKGKIPNAMGTRASEAIENEEILTLLMAIGYDPSLEEPFANLRAGRVILLCDSDIDGAHIQNLILATIIRFVPQLLEQNRVFIAKRYEYMTAHKGEFWFAETLQELEELAPKAAMQFATHLKGLGELDAEVLAEMAFNPEKRKLTRLIPPTKADVKRISDLAGVDNSHRKQLLGVA